MNVCEQVAALLALQICLDRQLSTVAVLIVLAKANMVNMVDCSDVVVANSMTQCSRDFSRLL